MGQCYSVVAKFIFKNNDSSGFCKIIRDKLSEMDYGGYHYGKSLAYIKSFMTIDGEEYNPKTTNMNHPFGLFKLITDKDAFCLEDENEIWSADFDASYSWESVMCEVFEEALTACESGSFVEIYPDSGYVKYSVGNDEITVTCNGSKYILDGHKWIEEEESDDEDENEDDYDDLIKW